MRRAAPSLAFAFGALLTLASPTQAHDLTFVRSEAVGSPADCVCVLPADVLWTERADRRPRPRPLRACAGRLATCGASEHAWSPDGRRLAVTGTQALADSPGGVGTAIFVIDVRSGRSRQLTDGPADDAADWSRNGEIAFQRSGARHDPDDVDVFAVRPDGSGLRRITSGGGSEPDWSPSGRRLAFVRGVGTGEDVFTVTAAGGELRRVTSSGWATSPAWSPDGRLIAYEDGGAIHVVGSGGGRPRAIVHPDRERSYDAPAWRPVEGHRRRGG